MKYEVTFSGSVIVEADDIDGAIDKAYYQFNGDPYQFMEVDEFDDTITKGGKTQCQNKNH